MYMYWFIVTNTFTELNRTRMKLEYKRTVYSKLYLEQFMFNGILFLYLFGH